MVNKKFDLSLYNGRIGHMIEQIGVEKVKELLNISKSQVYRYKKDASNMVFPDVVKLATNANLNLAWVATGQGDIESDFHLGEGNGIKICYLENSEEPPIYFAQEYLEKELKVDPDAIALVKVNDDSMAGSLKPGDVVLIDSTQKNINGIYALEINNLLTVKRLQYLHDGSLKIISDNNAYEDHVVPKEDEDKLLIAGKVVWHGGK